MARQEHPREDLLAEATALVRRVELSVPSLGDAIVVGFRTGGEASFYFDGDPAFHFNGRRELRRAFVDGLLYKADDRSLASLERRRRDGQVELIRHDLDDEQLDAFLVRLADNLRRLHEALISGSYAIVGQVPEQEDVVACALTWLSAIQQPVAVALKPGLR